MSNRFAPALAALAALGCGSSKPDPPATTAAPTTTAAARAPKPARTTARITSWPLFGIKPSRENATNAATGITAANVKSLKRRQVKLPGTVDSSPILLAGVDVGGARRDTAFMTTTYGKTLAVDVASGRILWTFTPPGYDGWAGSAQITNASPAADPSRRYVFTASPDGKVHRLSIASGRETGPGFPVTITRDPTHEKQTSSFNVSGRRLIVTTGGYIGDAPPYQGHVVSIDRASGRIVAVFNSLCSDRRRIITPSTCKSSDSAIWARSGAVVEPGSGDLLVATGNAPFDGRTDWGDSVLRLSAGTLSLKGNFTPTNVDELESTDADLGSTGPAILGHGLILQGGKDAILHVLSARKLRAAPGPHLGGEVQKLPAPGGQVFSAPAVWHHDGRTTVFVTTGSATAAYRVGAAGLKPVWSNDHGGTSPVVAGGLLWVQDPNGGLRVYRPGTGREITTLPSGPAHWNSPIVAGGRVVMPEGNANDHRTDGVLNIYRLP